MAVTSLLTTLLMFFLYANVALAVDYYSYKPSTSLSPYLPYNKSPSSSKSNLLNPIDSCRRSNRNWSSNRQSLADCSVGFGKATLGGKHGPVYVVTTTADDPVDPKPGTLRYGAVQTKPLWIVFKKDMVITLKNELIVNSYKTIDGRGAKVEIAYGPCLTIQGATHVIVHGISIHHCKPGKSGMVRSSPSHVGRRQGSDGDGIAVFGSSNVWIDHCYLARCTDGLIDVIHGSTGITISNNYFTQHDKVMLLGHNDKYTDDKIMKITIAFNHFGVGCIERMPRVRFGYAHVANNRYDEWQMYAIGGSANPTIFSQGNYFIAPDQRYAKQVTKREAKSGWKQWKWRSSGDVFQNGAYFVQSGYGTCVPPYTRGQSFKVAPGSLAPALTSSAGPLSCSSGKPC